MLANFTTLQIEWFKTYDELEITGASRVNPVGCACNDSIGTSIDKYWGFTAGLGWGDWEVRRERGSGKGVIKRYRPSVISGL